MVVKTFKKLAINEIQSYRLSCNTLNSVVEFNALETVRSLINEVDFFGDFIHIRTNGLIIYADSLLDINSPLKHVQTSRASQSTAHEAR